MQKYKIIGTFVLSLLMFSKAQSQDSLALDGVIAKTLESNFQIQVSQIQVKQNENLATRGQAGFYPQLSANGTGAYSRNNTKLEFAGGLPDVERNGAVNTSYGANLGLNYTVFNGFGRVRTYQGLIKQFQLSQVQAKMMAENLVLEAVNRYVNCQQAMVNVSLAESNLNVSRDRLTLAERGYQTGSKTQLDVLTARLDLQNDSLLWAQAQSAVAKEMHAINVLLGRDANTRIILSNQLPVPVLEEESVLLEKIKGNNTAVLLAKLTKELAENQRAIAQSRQMPSLNLSANYGMLNSQNGAGIILAQQNLGFNTSASLVVPIFNGNQLRTAIKNADLQIQIRDLELNQAQLSAQQLLLDALTEQSVLQNQIRTLEQGVAVATLALNRAQEAYKTGQIRYNDLRAAQTALLQAESSQQNARLNLIRLRFSVKRLLGELLD